MKTIFIIALLLLPLPAKAQQVVLLCTKNASGTMSCVPVDATHPLPVVLK